MDKVRLVTADEGLVEVKPICNKDEQGYYLSISAGEASVTTFICWERMDPFLRQCFDSSHAVRDRMRDLGHIKKLEEQLDEMDELGLCNYGKAKSLFYGA